MTQVQAAAFICNKQKYLIKVVGPIWFSSSDKDAIIPSDAIAVFDIPPFRAAMHPYLGVSFEYYTYELVNKFLTDLDLILNALAMPLGQPPGEGI